MKVTGNEKADELTREGARSAVLLTIQFFGISLQTTRFAIDK